MAGTARWRILFGGFLGYAFDAMDLILLSMALQSIMADCHSACNIDPLSRGIGVQNLNAD